MITPNDPIFCKENGRSVDLTMSFSHPFEPDGMVLDSPVAFLVTHQVSTTKLLCGWQDATVMDDQGNTLEYKLDRPGKHIFAMEPKPYWEPAEDAFTIRCTKTYVTAYGDDEGWDTELGLKTEIVPPTKPYGL